jgi:hypothetical protein
VTFTTDPQHHPVFSFDGTWLVLAGLECEAPPAPVAIPANMKLVTLEGCDEPLYVVDRSLPIEDEPEGALSPEADALQKAAYAWEHAVREIGNELKRISGGNLRAVNFAYIDALNHVRGEQRPIAISVPPKSSNMSPAGVFVYDTTKLPDNRLYLFNGPDSPAPLRRKGEALLALLVAKNPGAHVEHVEALGTMIFKRMLHQIGGHVNMMRTALQQGDEMLFERNFFMTATRLWTWAQGRPVQKEVNRPTLAMLPEAGAGVLDCADAMLYLFVSDVQLGGSVRGDLELAITFMNKQKEWAKRQVVIFDRATLPPQISYTFGG